MRSMIAGVLLIVLIAGLHAHETWLLPERFAAAAGTEVQLDLSSGMGFPELDHAIKPDRVESAGMRIGGKNNSKLTPTAAERSLRFTIRPGGAGLAAVWVTLKPRPIELTEKQVAEYFDEISASEAIRKAWADAGPGRRWREIYLKHSKTFVRFGDPSDDRSWAEPVGQRLEIVPEKDPTKLRDGDKLPVRVVMNGKPLTGFALNRMHQGKDVGKPRITDGEGRATIDISGPGRWLLAGTDLRRSRQEGVEWESDFVTLTIDVAPRMAGP